mmetsp:Transcript_49509/g.146246  ORF Transcript_49509/g.146246 Transcript_49509/m.146246 type:complete len:201 (+) Transcript_49509:62-664(+)
MSSSSLQSAGKALTGESEMPKFKRASTALDLPWYAPMDGGRTTTYERNVSLCEAVGDQAKKRLYLYKDRLPKEALAAEAIATGSAKAMADMPGVSVTLDPRIKGLMRTISENEGTRLKVRADPEFVNDIKRKQKIDHVTTIFTDVRMPADDMSNFQHFFKDFSRDAGPVDKANFMKKTPAKEYAEAVIKNRKMMEPDKGA